MSEIKPALTPEEWRRGILNVFGRFAWLQSDLGRLELGLCEPGDVTYRLDDDTAHGMAALCLYGQSFGFTRDHLIQLREEANWREMEARNHPRTEAAEKERAMVLREVADRIAALLPPREEYPLDRGDA